MRSIRATTLPTSFLPAIVTVFVPDMGLIRAQERETVLIESTETLQVGEILYVLGDIGELGEGDPKRAVRMIRGADATWRIYVSLPRGTHYSYQFQAAMGGYPCIAAPPRVVGELHQASTSDAAHPVPYKRVLYRGSRASPLLLWKQDDGPYRETVMKRIGPGRDAGESTWIASFGVPGREVAFHLQGSSTIDRDPPKGDFTTPLDALLVQDGQVFPYLPAPVVTPSRRDYDLASPPRIDSTALGHSRSYRVFLPRGYDEHPLKRYPVVYMHEGNVAFDSSSANFDQDGTTAAGLVRQGRLREVIVVGIDWHYYSDLNNDETDSRVRDFTPPDDVITVTGKAIPGMADRYVKFIVEELKPVIDAGYRTLAGPEDTGTVGFSISGLLVLYMGWDFTNVFRRIGAQSGSFWVPNYVNKVSGQPSRPLRFYLDSGTSSDNDASTIALYENLTGRDLSPYVVGSTMSFYLACGQGHDVAAAGTRWGRMLEFLYPVAEELSDLIGDCNANGAADAEDIASGESRDADANGVPDECEPGCNLDGVTSDCQRDCNRNAVADALEIAEGQKPDCNKSGIPDECELSSGAVQDCDGDGIPDVCEIGPFARVLASNGSGIEDSAFVGAPDGVSGDLKDSAVVFDFAPGTIVDGPGPDLTLYAGNRRLYGAIDVLASLDGQDYRSLNSTIREGVRIPGDELVTNLFSIRSFDLSGAGLATARFVRIQGLVASGNRFTLDSLGANNFSICLAPRTARLLRGDSNVSGGVDISDAVHVLNALFLGSTELTCLDAADSNDDGTVDISDPVAVLGRLFLGSDALPPPTEDCGQDPTADELDCAASPSCE